MNVFSDFEISWWVPGLCFTFIVTPCLFIVLCTCMGKKKRVSVIEVESVTPPTTAVVTPVRTHKNVVVPYTVKVEVHSSSSGAGSDENLSSSDLSERGSGLGGEHDYEDIYTVREEAGKTRSRSRDSGSHSRSASLSSTSSNVVVQLTTTVKAQGVVHDDLPASGESGVSSASPSDLGHSEEECEKAKPRVNHRHSLPYHPPSNRALKRVVSEPGACPPPPPPPPPENLSLPPSPTIGEDLRKAATLANTARKTDTSSQQSSRSSTTTEEVSIEEVSTSTVQEVSFVAVQRSASIVSGGGGSCIVSTPVADSAGAEESFAVQHIGPHLVNKQMVLPFIPPKFPNNVNNSNALIKPSEYLRSISSVKPAAQCQPVEVTDLASEETTVENQKESTDSPSMPSASTLSNKSTVIGPPPPPLPEPPAAPSPPSVQEPGLEEAPPTAGTIHKSEQPLSTISIQDLNSVQLRRTNKTLSKTMSAPPRTLSTSTELPFQAQKQDLIEELKLSKDITGIKKMKVERVKIEEQQEKDMVTEITRQLSVDSFVEKIPDKDSAGNPIPPWKRQMLAKKAAEKAKKELEEELARQAEEKRLQAIPAWKRQLLQAKKPEDKSSIYITTKHTVEEKRPASIITPVVVVPMKENNKENSKPTTQPNKEILICLSNSNQQSQDNDEEPAQIIPWRAQLRKTNSTLNLLE